ncbi:hypothetical protein C8A03DRAFT_30050 [Achaetomium macrosporum]|uniref:Uncharacterized protein n=1 Tax=Achaetomium macrosporum TaxID=79813 RepID=A0AAN7CGP4_9PEZI|nr:hypothetical protein C8A03DRAFT_30050 [Achaetomium macrosporum]
MALEPDNFKAFTAAHILNLLHSDAGFFKELEVIKQTLAMRPGSSPIESAQIDATIRSRRASFEEPPLTDSAIEKFLAQERLFFAQLEDLPTVERQMRILNLLVEDRLSAIFMPLHEFMNAQLRFLLDTERNLLWRPRHQRWSAAFKHWSRNAQLCGKLIGSEIRNKAVLKARLGTAEGNQFGPQADTIAACFRLISLPARSMLGHLEFLEDMNRLIDDADPRKPDILESRDIFREAHGEISIIANKEDLSELVSGLKPRVVDWGYHDISLFGDLIWHDAGVDIAWLRPYRYTFSPLTTGSTYYTYRTYMFEKVLIFAAEAADGQEPSEYNREHVLPRSMDKGLKLKGIFRLSSIEAVVSSPEQPGPCGRSTIFIDLFT